MEPEINFERFGQAECVQASFPWAVYKAVDMETGRWVRLSVMRPAGALSSERSRACLDWFAEAGYQAQRLAHPALARVLSYRSEVAAAWVATEAPRGSSLKERLSAHGRMPMEQAMAISSVVARALGAAHEAGWAHGFLNSEDVWIDDDVVTVCDLGLAIAAQSMIPSATPYAAPLGFLSADPRRKDMQCLGLLVTEMLNGVLPDPVGVPRSEVFPPNVPAAAVKRIRALVNPQSEDAMSPAEWAEYARVGEPEPPPVRVEPMPQPDERYYEPAARRRPMAIWAAISVSVVLVALVVAVMVLWQRTIPPLTTGLRPAPASVVAPATSVQPPSPDTLTKVQVGPVAPADEEKTVRRLKAMGFLPYIKPQGDVLYIQVGAFANADSAKATEDQLRRAGFTVRVQ